MNKNYEADNEEIENMRLFFKEVIKKFMPNGFDCEVTLGIKSSGFKFEDNVVSDVMTNDDSSFKFEARLFIRCKSPTLSTDAVV